MFNDDVMKMMIILVAVDDSDGLWLCVDALLFGKYLDETIN